MVAVSSKSVNRTYSVSGDRILREP
jgi:hypothetical protein